MTRLTSIALLLAAWVQPLSSVLRADMPPGETDRREPLVGIVVDPPRIRLTRADDRFSILVDGRSESGRLVDLTREAEFHSTAPERLAVSSRGVVRARSDGKATVEV